MIAMVLNCYCPNCKKRFPFNYDKVHPRNVRCIVCGYRISLVNVLADAMNRSIYDEVRKFFLITLKKIIKPELFPEIKKDDIETLVDAFLEIQIRKTSKNKVYHELDISGKKYATSEVYKMCIAQDGYDKLVINVEKLIRVANMGNTDNMTI